MQILKALRSNDPVQVTLAVLFISTLVKVKTNTSAVMTVVLTNLNLVFQFIGAALFVELATNTWAGTITSFKVFKKGAPNKSIDVTLPTETSMADLNKAADGISGKPNPGNVGAVEKVMQPKTSPYPDTQITGHDGKDTAKGFGRNDSMDLKGGNDKVYASKGNLTIDAGSGRDTYDASFFKIGARVDLTKGTAKIGSYTSTLTSVENVIGTSANDKITGNAASNRLVGGKGDDVINGRGGNDTLEGGPGNDKITGGNGRDKINGGPGNDTLTGGAGPDTFVFNGRPKAKNGVDHITDWETGIDKLKISGAKAKDVTVKTVNGDTHVEFHNSKVILDNVQLDKADIDFLF